MGDHPIHYPDPQHQASLAAEAAERNRRAAREQAEQDRQAAHEQAEQDRQASRAAVSSSAALDLLRVLWI